MTEIASVCVYCGSRLGNDPRYRAAAEELGLGLAERGIELVFGGGHVGLMGITSDAVRAGGGKVTGIIPRDLKEREHGEDTPGELIVVDNMHERKMRMARSADAFVILPGGLGTLDETFEIVTWRQLGFHDKPIIIADIGGYWAPMRAMLGAIIAEGFAEPVDDVLIRWAGTIPDVFALLAGAPPPDRELDTSAL